MLRGLWNNITFILCGPSEKLIASDLELQGRLRKMLKEGRPELTFYAVKRSSSKAPERAPSSGGRRRPSGTALEKLPTPEGR